MPDIRINTINSAAVIYVLLLLLNLGGCSNSDDEYSRVEGVIQVSMMMGRGNGGFRNFTSQVNMITDDAVLLLLIDQNTKFVDPEVDEGVLQLGDIYRAETEKYVIPKGITINVDVEVDEIRIVKRLERIGPAGPDAPTREKVRRAKAFKMIPEVTELAKRVSEGYREIASGIVDYEAPKLAFINRDEPAKCDIPVYSPIPESSASDRSTKYFGTFYCQPSATVFVDQNWMVDLETGWGAGIPHDMEYMLAHSYAHHVQDLSGNYIEKYSGRELADDFVQIVIEFELQADCLAGMAVKQISQELIELGDLEEAMATVSQVGKDAYFYSSDERKLYDPLDHDTPATRLGAATKGFNGTNVSACLE